MVAQTGEDAAPELCVCRVVDAVLGDVALSGKRPLVIVADGNVKIAGAVRVLAGTRYRYSNPAYGSAGGLGGSFGSVGGGEATTAYGNETLVPLMGGMFGQAVCADTSCKPEAASIEIVL